MSHSKLKPKSRTRIQIYNVPPEWVEILEREAKAIGLSISDYVKVVILKPYIEKLKYQGG